MPAEYKYKVIQQLKELLTTVEHWTCMSKHPQLLPMTIQQIQDNINFLEAQDLSDKWNDTLAFNHRLDNSRNQGPFEKVCLA